MNKNLCDPDTRIYGFHLGFYMQRIDNLKVLAELKLGDRVIKKLDGVEKMYTIQSIRPDKVEMGDGSSSDRLVLFNSMMLLSGEWWTEK